MSSLTVPNLVSKVLSALTVSSHSFFRRDGLVMSDAMALTPMSMKLVTYPPAMPFPALAMAMPRSAM